MTIGIFIPAFSFTIIGHEFFEAIVDNKFVEPFLDGVGAAVIGTGCEEIICFVQGLYTKHSTIVYVLFSSII